jgi:murein DD-endopeptidase MepM/ murein hydrolase activator NlpD
MGHLGEEINKEAIKAGKTVEQGADHLGKEINIAAIKSGEAATRFGKEFEKGFCDAMTLGGYSRGEASCGVSAGVGRDQQGPYTFDPSKPDEKHRGDSRAKSETPSAKELDRMARILNAGPPHYYEYDFEKVFGLERFMPGNYKLGIPWPNSEGPIAAPTREGIVRSRDKIGGGGFLAPRIDKKTGAARFHVGIDYVAMPGQKIMSPVTGDIVRTKNPGKAGLTGLEVKTAGGYVASIFYVAPTQEVSKAIAAGGTEHRAMHVEAGKTVIGYAQDLSERYGQDITNHVHVTLQDPQGKYIDPEDPKIAVAPRRASSAP